MDERRLHPAASSHLRGPLTSIALIFAEWLVLQFGGMFHPGLLDDVDSVYLEVAREMLHRHDYVTPFIDGIRFFDKPPLMYWMAAGSMRVFGEYDWAGRLPLALAVLVLLLSVYALGRRFYAERGGLYAALVLGTAVGPYLYTRFFIPDIMIALWITLGVHLFLAALDRAGRSVSALWPSLGFAAVLALNLLTKGLIGLVFPLCMALLYLLLTRQLASLRRMHLGLAALTFAAVALPWHILAALRNPAIAMPSGLGLPAKAGWAWFYLYNEHIARFLGRRVPHDYGLTPVWLFLVYTLIWMMPWATFLPAALSAVKRDLGHHVPVTGRSREAALTLTLWAGVVLGFFSISNRQEYYSLPALPALALMIGGVLAAAEVGAAEAIARRDMSASAVALCHRWLLLPIALALAVTCAYYAAFAPRPATGTDLSALLAQNPELYNLSLGHLFDLTGAAMGLFRGPLTAVAIGMLVLGPASDLLRKRHLDFVANLALAAGMTVVLLAAHEGLVRFNPIMGSKALAMAILHEQEMEPSSGDQILLDGELTSGSTLLFYTRQPVFLVDGRVNGPWFGSFWPDAPAIFEDETSLRRLWDGPQRVFLMTYRPDARRLDLAHARTLAVSGGKTILVNR